MSGADENIAIDVDDSAIDAAIAKLDEALRKTAEVVGETPEVAIPQSAGANSVEFFTIPNSEVDSEIASMKAKVAQAVAEAEEDLKAESAKASLTDAEMGNLVSNEEDRLRGLNYSVRRVTAQIPGLREAYHYVEALKRIERFGLMDIGGVVSVLMLAYTLYRQLAQMMEEQKRQQAEYRQNVMAAQNFATTEQFIQWQTNQRQAFDSYRSGIIP